MSFVVFCSLPLCSPSGVRSSPRSLASSSWLDAYRQPAARLIAESMGDSFAWRRLALLTDTAGHRLSGTPQLDKAIQWAVAEMKRDGLENVHTEPVMVPKWVRGRESAEIVEPARHTIAMLGLGESIGTPAVWITGRSDRRSKLRRTRSKCREGQRAHRRLQRAVHDVQRFATCSRECDDPCGSLWRPRRACPIDWAARAATAPHRQPAICQRRRQDPGAAIATEDADRLQRMADRGEKIVIRLQMEGHFEPDVESANVVGEFRGREKPDEFVVIGGHLDSWDVGAGASDDGGGCIATWEALRLMKKLGLQPRRSVRVVLWTNEENGTRGARAYRDRHIGRAAQSRHDARSGRRAVSARVVRRHRHSESARDGGDDRVIAEGHQR